MHVTREILTVEVVVPRTALWNHEETEELVTQDHLNFFKEAGRVLRWIGL